MSAFADIDTKIQIATHGDTAAYDALLNTATVMINLGHHISRAERLEDGTYRLFCDVCGYCGINYSEPFPGGDTGMATHLACGDPAPLMRRAEIIGTPDLERVAAYLPRNYWLSIRENQCFLIGYDNAGWTLEGYVIPRLASGNVYAKEVQE